ncbi:MAG TPA: hypothetical protein VLI45_10855 [Acidobacteriaceae bacterium]|nr:hypothetical protein [Acidobacteriaceae bacterium]
MSFRTLALAAVAALFLASPLSGQDMGYWRAVSSTAKSTTGDITLSAMRVTIDFSSFTIAQIRALKPEEWRALFDIDPGIPGSGNIYRLDIPGSKRFLHKNTLCGSEDTQYMVTFVNGNNLQLAFFSGAKIPALTPDAMNNNSNLCGTYSYAH